MYKASAFKQPCPTGRLKLFQDVKSVSIMAVTLDPRHDQTWMGIHPKEQGIAMLQEVTSASMTDAKPTARSS